METLAFIAAWIIMGGEVAAASTGIVISLWMVAEGLVS